MATNDTISLDIVKRMRVWHHEWCQKEILALFAANFDSVEALQTCNGRLLTQWVLQQTNPQHWAKRLVLAIQGNDLQEYAWAEKFLEEFRGPQKNLEYCRSEESNISKVPLFKKKFYLEAMLNQLRCTWPGPIENMQIDDEHDVNFSVKIPGAQAWILTAVVSAPRFGSAQPNYVMLTHKDRKWPQELSCSHNSYEMSLAPFLAGIPCLENQDRAEGFVAASKIAFERGWGKVNEMICELGLVDY